MKSEKVTKIFARGENQPHLFTIHFYFLLSIHMGEAMPPSYSAALHVLVHCAVLESKHFGHGMSESGIE